MDLEGQLKTKLRAEMVTLTGLEMSGAYLHVGYHNHPSYIFNVLYSI